MDSLWSFYYWIDNVAGQLGAVAILGAMLAAGLYWLLGTRLPSEARRALGA